MRWFAILIIAFAGLGSYVSWPLGSSGVDSSDVGCSLGAGQPTCSDTDNGDEPKGPPHKDGVAGAVGPAI
jgi:hypothetical protein